MMMDGDIWHGRRIVGSDFAREAIAPQYHLRNVGYGFLWWSI